MMVTKTIPVCRLKQTIVTKNIPASTDYTCYTCSKQTTRTWITPVSTPKQAMYPYTIPVIISKQQTKEYSLVVSTPEQTIRTHYTCQYTKVVEENTLYLSAHQRRWWEHTIPVGTPKWSKRTHYTSQHTEADIGDKYYTCQHTKADDEDIDVGGKTAADAANTAQQTACH